MVSVLHKEQEYKVEKLKLQEGWRSCSRGSESNPNFQMVNKPSWIKFYSRDWLIQSIIYQWWIIRGGEGA